MENYEKAYLNSIVEIINKNIGTRSNIAYIGKNIKRYSEHISNTINKNINIELYDNEKSFFEKCVDTKGYYFIFDLYSDSTELLMRTMRCSEIFDYIYRKPKPIYVQGLFKEYSDNYGNIIKNLPKNVNICLKGYNNYLDFETGVYFGPDSKITVDNNVFFQCKSCVKLGNNSLIILHDLSRFIINENSRFASGSFVTCGQEAEIIIGKGSTFGKDNELIANAFHSVILGCDIITSRNCVIRAGDGHSIFDVMTGKKINFQCNEKKNRITKIGNHVWIGYRSIILSPTKIGSGCIVGAGSILKGNYPNNCTIAGSIAKVVKINSAWSRNPLVTDIDKACNHIYAIPTITLDIVNENKKHINEIEDFFDYFESVSKMSNVFFVIAAKKSLGKWFDEKVQRAIQKTGLGMQLENKLCCGYVGILNDKKVEYEELGVSEKKVEYIDSIENYSFDVLSSPLKNGTAKIEINGFNYAINECGLNCVLFDKESSQIIDSVCFNTHTREKSCVRKLLLC